MATFITILHVVVALALILIVLLQTGKGASMGAAFGGGASSTVFGSRGAGSFLGKVTAAAAILFMLTCLGLSIYGHKRIGGDSIMEGVTPQAQQEAATPEPAAPPSPAEQMPTEQAEPIQAPDNQ